MKTIKIATIICVTMCAASALLNAQSPTVRKPVFVGPGEVDGAALLPAPPPMDSWQTRMELAELHRIQQTRTDADIAHAKADDVQEDMFVFATVLGPEFAAAKLPATKLLSDHLKNDEGVNVGPIKKAFQRPRPYQFDPTLKAVCKTTTNTADYSYPSGHGTTGYLMGLTLVIMVPEKRAEILARADDYGHSRLVCGVHYPADEVASRTIAYTLIGAMLKNPQYVQELAAAREETRKALKLSAAK